MGSTGLSNSLETLRPAGKPRQMSSSSRCSLLTIFSGGFEKICIARDYLGYYKYLVCLGTYSRPFAGEESLSKAVVLRALKQCITEHHILAAIIKDGDTEAPQLAVPSTMDLDKHLRIYESDPANDNATFEQLLEVAHNEPLDRSQPPWRVHILPLASATSQRFHLAFVHSHAFTDGRSGYMFHQTFLEALREAEKLPFNFEPVFEVPSDYRLAPALEETETKLFITKEFAMATLAQAKAPPKEGESEIWTGAPTRPWRLACDEFPMMSLKLFTVPLAVVQKAVAACRSHGARLTGLLDYAISRAIIRELRLRDQEYSQILGFTPIDLRAVLNLDNNLMANLSGTVNDTVEVTPDFLEAYPNLRMEDWKAVENKTNLLREKSMSLQDQIVRMLAYVPAARPYVAGLARVNATESYCLSNLGALNTSAPDSDQAPWTIDDVAFSQSCNGIGPPLSFSAASTKNGALNISVTWVPGILGIELDDERPFVRDVCASIIEQLEAVAE